MRGLKSTIALVVVLAGLGGYIYFVTLKKPADDGTPKLEKVFASLQADKISELKVTSSSGDVTTLKKDKNAWQMTAPIVTRASDMEATTISTDLSTLEVSHVVDENPADLKDYGLVTPRIQIEFKVEGDKDYRRLLVGEKSATGMDLYAKRNDEKRVFLIPTYVEPQLDQSTFDLRDKLVLKFEHDKVNGIDMSADGKTTLQAAKQGMDWKLLKPFALPADYSSVDQLLGRLQSAAMKSIVTADATAADLKKYGFDKPSGTLSVSTDGGRSTLVIGGKTPGAKGQNDYYVRDAARPVVMTIDGSFLDELKKSGNDYRRKDLFEFRGFNADRIEIARMSQTVAFEKVKAQGSGADKWRRVSPNAGDVDGMKMETLLAKLENMRANSFVDSTAKTGLDKPAATVYAKFDDGKKEERVTFGQVGTEAYASRPGEPGAAKVSAAEFTDLNKALDDVAK